MFVRAIICVLAASLVQTALLSPAGGIVDKPLLSSRSAIRQHERHRQLRNTATLNPGDKKAPIEAEQETDSGKQPDDANKFESKSISDVFETAEGGKEVDNAGLMFGITMFGTIIILMMAINMSLSENQTIRTYTVVSLDNVMAIFLAVLFYQAYDEILVWIFPVRDHMMVAVWCHAIFVLLLAYLLSFHYRQEGLTLAIFCAAAAHYVSFASMHASTAFIGHHFSAGPLTCFVGVVVVLALVVMIIIAMQFFGRKLFMVWCGVSRDREEEKEWHEKLDDVSNDFGAMAVAVCWSLFVRAAISGDFDALHTDKDSEAEHTFQQRMLMLAYGLATLPVSCFVVHYLTNIKHDLGADTYWKKRAIMFATSCCCMGVAWAFLLWGEWQFEASVEEGIPEIMNKALFAICATFALVLGIHLIAYLKKRSVNARHFHQSRRVALTAMALVVGWSWEECFDSAMEAVADGFGGDKHIKKYLLAAVIGAFVVSTYASYLKPYSMQCEDAHERMDEGEDEAAAEAEAVKDIKEEEK